MCLQFLLTWVDVMSLRRGGLCQQCMLTYLIGGVYAGSNA